MQVLYQLSYTPKGFSMLAVTWGNSQNSVEQDIRQAAAMGEKRAMVALNFDNFITAL